MNEMRRHAVWMCWSVLCVLGAGCGESAKEKPAPVVLEDVTGCTTSADCTLESAPSRCDTQQGICVPSCTKRADCEGDAAGPVCDVASGECVAACASAQDCASNAAGPYCDTETGECGLPPRGHLIGTGDGSTASVSIVTVYQPAQAAEAPDLEFHPERDELWVLNRRFEVEGVCAQANPGSPRCVSLGGFTTILFKPGTPEQEARVLEDQNSWHFMRRPPALAMGAKDTFATCGEAFTGNFEDDPTQFIGPTLWSSDLAIYTQPSGGNGSHLDMLHATPWCMGIAHERDNVYWVHNGEVGSIDRYDFHMDHGPGADYHGDGEIYRYVEGTLKRVENVPSHMEFHDADAHVYIADTGNARVVKLNTKTGESGAPFGPVYEPLAGYSSIVNAELTEVVPAGAMTQPSGLAIHDEVLYLGDHATGKIHAYSLAGEALRTLDTGLGAGALAGLTIGPNEKLWFTNMKTGAVYRVDP